MHEGMGIGGRAKDSVGSTSGSSGSRRASSTMCFAPIGLLAACLLAACGAPASVGSRSGGGLGGSSAEVAPLQLRVRWQVYSTGQDFALASQGLLDRASTYSQAVPLSAAGTKIAPDEIVHALIEHLDGQGVRSQPGAAPAAGQGWSQSIEIEEGGAKRWIGVGAASTPEEHKRFRECWMAFTAVYNQTYQLQTVDEAPDWQRQDSDLERQRRRTKSP